MANDGLLFLYMGCTCYCLVSILGWECVDGVKMVWEFGLMYCL